MADDIDFSKIGSGDTDKRYEDTFEGREEAKLRELRRIKGLQKHFEGVEKLEKIKRKGRPYLKSPFEGYAKGGMVRGCGKATKGRGKVRMY